MKKNSIINKFSVSAKQLSESLRRAESAINEVSRSFGELSATVNSLKLKNNNKQSA